MAIKPSPRFILLLLLLHTLAAAVLYVTALPLAVKLAIFLLILLSLSYYLCRDALLLCADSWREVLLDQNGVSVVRRDGSSFPGQVSNQTVLTPYFVILHIGRSGHHLSVARVIFPDAIGTGQFREMCVRLKFA